MNLLIAICVAGSMAAVSGNLDCDYSLPNVPTDWIHMSQGCVNAMRRQIGYEMSASTQFLAMGAYFSRDSVNRIGFSDFFYDYADEEREHGINLAEYLVNRGELTTGISDLFQLEYVPQITEWPSVTAALTDAIGIEGNLTGQIRGVIDICEHADNFEDYALDDWLTAAWLKTQYHNQFELADMISSLTKLNVLHEQLGEFIADVQLLDSDDDDEEDDDDDEEDDDE